ncbi:MAG TPA: adenosylcobinamide-phosphate synthase CbiB [Aestuariivirga sp.]|nr:adenosylcobinamide-phosphate synthase CbiB [Aestuariivirga sp.]
MILHFTAAALALLIERLFGYPKSLYDKIGHPVEWIGIILKKLETLLYDPEAEPLQARLRGLAALLALLFIVAIPAVIITSVLSTFAFGWIIEALLATALIAQHSLYEHVSAVGKGLDTSLSEGRKAVARIVGRDPTALDESGVVKGALESLAENTSDGIVAPVLWYALFGLPGIVAYKAINTADSMIGHKSERYIYFGWAAARLDDLINLPASRLTGLLFAAAAAWNDSERGKIAVQIMWRDAPKHQSPNAGWPESALAASLGVRLGGPRSYDGSRVDLPWMGEGRGTLNRDDIRKGLRFYGTAMTFLFCGAALCALLF